LELREIIPLMSLHSQREARHLSCVELNALRIVIIHRETKADTLKQLRPLGEGDQELEKRLVREELT
jgi:hypothetical protein